MLSYGIYWGTFGLGARTTDHGESLVVRVLEGCGGWRVVGGAWITDQGTLISV